MTYKRKIIIVTGQLTSGKTTLLVELIPTLKKRWSVDGFVSLSTQRELRSYQAAEEHRLQLIGKGTNFLWAKRKADHSGYSFAEESQVIIQQELTQVLELSPPEIFILDNLGFLELSGKGFHTLLKSAVISNGHALIISVKKEAVPQFIEQYGLQDATIVDLDTVNLPGAKHTILKQIKAIDAEKIGLYATISASVEVGLGSFLHSLHLPLKGHFLASLQNFLLILFGKDLRGRGLFWIVFITSGLKSFSPAGAKLKPMLYIFIQGVVFILPITAFGWNIMSVLIGSTLLGWCTLFLSLFLDYITFGRSVIEAYVAGVNTVFETVGLAQISFWHFIIGVTILKTLIALGVAVAGYMINFTFLIEKFKTKLPAITTKEVDFSTFNPSLRASMLGALRDLTLRRVLVPFILLSLLIYFFADLTGRQFLTVIIRGLLISWFGFLVARRINFRQIIAFLHKYELEYVAVSMEKALNVVQTIRKNRS